MKNELLSARLAVESISFDLPEIAEITCTCFAAPAQWEGLLTNGSRFYLRYRHGRARLDIPYGVTVWQQDLCADPSDSWIDLQALLALIGLRMAPGVRVKEDFEKDLA